ncbi:ATP-binding protein [Sulfurospirillum arcachonense]|uniref:sensor histidine kinase n=1 Tax=Sulfurospirillum arcachonense TaxID=57666 RepID=UPI00046803BA|nr:ATP-binding protein [Sulfurospirillum arcachonense]
MFKIWKKHSINQMNIIAILFAGIFAFTSAFVIIFNEFREFNNEIATIEKSYIQNQKRRALEEASRVYRLVQYQFNELKEKDESTIKNLIAKEVGAVLDNSNSKGYIFIYDKNKNVIYKSKQIKYDDSVITEFIKIGKKGSGFVTFETIEQSKSIENLAFVKFFKEKNWIVGSGMYIDKIDNVLAKKRDDHRNKITGFILKILTLTLFLYLASILKYRYVTDKITKEIRFIVESLKKASKKYTFIDTSKIKFEEFKEITAQANYMLTKLKEKKSELEDLNTNLESLVEKKTDELQNSVEYTKHLLEEQDKFLKNAIHEINTPLTIILMNIELYNLKNDKNPYLLKIEAAVKVLENIYGDLIFIIRKDKVDNKVDMINFTDFVKSRIEYFKDVAIGNKLQIKSEIEDDIFILFNEFELQRLCDNNFSNAIKYSHINETIHVRLHSEDESTIFEVENKGEKIVSVDKLFDRYYREDVARGGFGLGLNIVHEICEKNNVSIDVLSNGKKTVFKYSFECSRRVE